MGNWPSLGPTLLSPPANRCGLAGALGATLIENGKWSGLSPHSPLSILHFPFATEGSHGNIVLDIKRCARVARMRQGQAITIAKCVLPSGVSHARVGAAVGVSPTGSGDGRSLPATAWPAVLAGAEALRDANHPSLRRDDAPDDPLRTPLRGPRSPPAPPVRGPRSRLAPRVWHLPPGGALARSSGVLGAARGGHAADEVGAVAPALSGLGLPECQTHIPLDEPLTHADPGHALPARASGRAVMPVHFVKTDHIVSTIPPVVDTEMKRQAPIEESRKGRRADV